MSTATWLTVGYIAVVALGLVLVICLLILAGLGVAALARALRTRDR